MPALLAVALRYLIMAAVQLGIWSLIEQYGIPLLNKAIQEIIELFGVSEEEAKDMVANSVLQAFEQVGIFAITLKSKLPLKVADYLGFTTKGWSLRKLSPKLADKFAVSGIASTVTKVATTEEVDAVAKVISSGNTAKYIKIGALFFAIQQVVSTTSGVFTTVGNWIDFANWQGAYQRTFQKLFASIGIEPDTPLPKANTISADVWKRIYSTVEELNPVSIAFPWDNTVKPYSRLALVEATDHFAANLAKQKIDPTYKNVFGLLLPVITLKEGTTTTVTTPTKTTSTTTQLTTPKVQVFTGVLSQGVLGKGLEFQARPDDLIENAQEMLDAASNNLAPFIAALPSRITYQVRVVNSITTKDGFTQKGSVTQIVTGYDAKGVPKYKTVVNKFAVLDISILNDKNSHVKITTIVLGPVDSVKFQVQQGTLNQIQTGLQKVATTSNIGAIKGIETVSPVTVTTPQNQIINNGTPATTTQTTNKPVGFRLSFTTDSGMAIYTADDGNRYDSNGAPLYQDPKNPNNFSTTPYAAPVVTSTPSTTTSTTTQTSTAISTPAPAVSTPAPVPQSTVKKGATATNLSEWYTANGQSLPSLATRATLYQQYGLGQANYYTGTAEQNTNLLNKLKSL